MPAGEKTKLLWNNPEYREKMRVAHLGQIVWNKGIKTGIVPKSAFKKGCTSLNKGRECPKSVKERISLSKIGKPQLKQRGKLHWHWKGGTSQIEDKKIRQSLEYKQWRRAVFQRDNYMCILGGKEHGSKLRADHIKPFSLFPELRFILSNGRTLCEECHKKTDTYGGRLINKKYE